MAEPGYRNALAIRFPTYASCKPGYAKSDASNPARRNPTFSLSSNQALAPSWKSISIPIPIPTGKRGLIATPLSFPIIKAENKGFVPPAINAAKRQIPVETLANIDAMAPSTAQGPNAGYSPRTVIRAVLKSVAQDQANKAGAVVGLLTTVASVVSEQGRRA